MEPVIEIEGLCKDFHVGFWQRRTRILDSLNLTIYRGEIFGYLGPNGAGKTTTLKLLTGLILPTAGSARLLGEDLTQVPAKEHIGFLPENPYFYDYLTGREFLDFCGRLFGLRASDRRDRISRLLRLIEMEEAADRQLRKYSKGMLQRLGLAQALINDPRLVILDEPMSGLDPLGRKVMRDLILTLKAQGRTIFFSTHILPDVEVLCDRVGILVAGRLRDAGRLDQILKTETESIELTLQQVSLELLAHLRNLTQAPILDQPDGVLIRLPDEERLDLALRAAVTAGGRVVSVAPQRVTLEAHFLREVQGASP
ncbi:MAG TPA: ABC transporter ATP-binding protein [Candidatus Methylomirabilis sp.]|nr:ABC transporter ATP-binding protein [Candidatus Methylomirabilis sp.]